MALQETEQEQSLETIFSPAQEEESLDTVFSQEQEEESLDTVFSPQQEDSLESVFTPVGREAQRQRPQFGPPSDEISPFNFGREAIGNPWSRGAQNAINAFGNFGDMVADYREGLRGKWEGVLSGVVGDDIANTLSKAIVPDQEIVDFIARQTKDYAKSINARPSNLGKAETMWDYFEPNRMYQTIAEGLPLTGALMGLTVVNPAAGTALMAGVEGGDSYQAIKRYEEATGEEVSQATKILTPIVVGSVNASLERFGIDRIIKVGRGTNGGIKNTLTKTLLAGLTETGTEGLQEFNQAIAEYPYSGIVPDNIWERVTEGAYAGFLIGTTLGGSNAVLSSARNRSPNDVTIDTWNEVGDSFEPVFRINKAGHTLEGQTVTLEQLQGMEDLNVPRFQRERLKKEMVKALPKNFPDAPNATPEMVADMNLRVLEMVSESFGYDTVDTFIEEHGIIVRNGRIEKGDLLQAEAFHGTPHDFDRFSTDFLGTGEGVQAFGWGLYFTESRGIAEEYARRLSKNAFQIGINNRTFKDGLAFEDALFEYLGMEGMNREVETDAANVIFDILTQTGNAKDGVNITEANKKLETLKERYRKQRVETEEKLALWTERQSNVMEFEFQRELQKINTDLNVLEKINLEDFNIVQEQGKVYKVTLNKGKDTSEYKWLPWRDEVSYEDFKQLRDHIKEIQLRNEYSRDYVANQYRMLGDRLYRMEEMRNDPATDRLTGLNVYTALSVEFGSKGASKLLADAGFAGTKYEANAGQSSSYNFVVFDDSIVTIEGVDTLFQKGFRGRGNNIGEASEGAGLYVADTSSMARLFGDPKEINFTDPKNPLIADVLFLLEGDYGTLKDIADGKRKAPNDWWRINAEAYDRVRKKHGVEDVLDMSYEDRDIVNAIGEEISNIAQEEGYDAIRVTPETAKEVELTLGDNDQVSGWTVLLDESLVEGGFGQYFQHDQFGAKASVNFSDGQTLIKIFQSADPSSVLHELGHIFRRYMPADMLEEANRVFEVEDGVWTRAKEEEFARKWEQWFSRGRLASDKGANIFTRFRDWLVEIYGRAHATLGGEMSTEQLEFFDSIFESLEADIAKLPDGQRESVLGQWFDKLMELMDIEYAGRQMGMPETFFHLKNRFSVESMYTQEGVDVITQMPATVRRNRGKSADAVLLAESSESMNDIMAKEESSRTDVEQAAVVLRDYFDKSQHEYEARGINIGFRERLLGELQARLENEQMRDADRDRLQSLYNALTEVGDIEFVHIPFNFWFRSTIQKDPVRASRLWLDIEAVARKRDTLRIADLVEAGVIQKEDVRPSEILSSYAKIKGKDFAMLNIREAAIEEGAIMPRPQGESAQPGFKTPPPNMRMFKDMQIREPLYRWMVDQMSPTPLGRFRSAINMTKMWAFWNPLFLPMYDVVQSHMAGAMNILDPVRTFKQINKGFSDVLNWTADARIAQAEGLHSVPFNSPLEQLGQDMDIASRTRHSPYDGTVKKLTSWTLARGEHMFRDVLEKTFDANDSLSFLKQLGGIRPALRNIYELSWGLAWHLDNSVRQVTYNHFIEQGYTPREAAQTAARSHADYASVPPKTRKQLNTIFFTPTFKIAMGKWMIDSIRSVGNVLAGDATITHKQRAAVIARTLAILGAFDMLLLSLGFDRDEWGRRYVRKVDTATGDRELVINWTGPHNLFLKYMQRTEEAFGPEVPNSMLRVFQQNSWEVTPLFRIASSVVTNTTPGGEKLWFVGDDPEIKVAKGLTYAVTSSINVLQQLTNEDAFGQEGAEAFAREYGQLLEVVTAPFVFKYTRQTPEVRLQQKLQMMMRIHEEEVEARNLFTQLMRSGGNPQEILEQYVDGKGPFKVGAVQRSENLVRRMQQLIWDFEAEQWDQWGPDVRDVGVPGGQWDPNVQEGESLESVFE